MKLPTDYKYLVVMRSYDGRHYVYMANVGVRGGRILWLQMDMSIKTVNATCTLKNFKNAREAASVAFRILDHKLHRCKWEEKGSSELVYRVNHAKES